MADIYYSDTKKPCSVDSILNCLKEAFEIYEKIGICYFNLKEWFNAKSYFEKNLNSSHFSIDDTLSLAEIYLIMGIFNEAYEILNKPTAEENPDNRRYLVPLFLSISLILLNKVDDAYNYLTKIGEPKQFFIDAITLLKGETSHPIIRLKDVKIISEEVGKQAEVFHPFTGSLTITKDDENLKEIMQKLSLGTEIDLDVPEIMGIERNKALLILGFLFRKGFLDCKTVDKQKSDLKLTDRGLKILRLSKTS